MTSVMRRRRRGRLRLGRPRGGLAATIVVVVVLVLLVLSLCRPLVSTAPIIQWCCRLRRSENTVKAFGGEGRRGWTLPPVYGARDGDAVGRRRLRPRCAVGFGASLLLLGALLLLAWRRHGR